MAPNSPPHSADARLAVLEDGARRAELSERDLWRKLSELREHTADDLKELRALFDENMKASAEIITAAREVVKRVEDVVRRQDNSETASANTQLAAFTAREASLQRAEDNAKAIDARMRAIEEAQRDRNVRNRTLIAAWSMLAGLVSAGAVAIFHKLFP